MTPLTTERDAPAPAPTPAPANPIAAAPPKSGERFHQLDGLRAVASLIVVIHHSFTPIATAMQNSRNALVKNSAAPVNCALVSRIVLLAPPPIGVPAQSLAWTIVRPLVWSAAQLAWLVAAQQLPARSVREPVRTAQRLALGESSRWLASKELPH